MFASFHTLTAQTVTGCLRYAKQFCAVAVIVAVAITLVRSGYTWQSHYLHERLIDREGIADDIELLSVLQQEQKMGTADLDDEIRSVRSRVALRMQALAGYSGAHTVPQLALLFLSSLLITLLTLTTATWAMVRMVHTSSWRQVTRDSLHSLSRMFTLLFAAFLLSLLWIPLLAVFYLRLRGVPLPEPAATIQTILIFLGYLVAVLLLPRLALAPCLLLQKGDGILSSLLESYDRSRGHWGRILNNILMAGVLLLLVTSILIGLVASALGYDSWPFLLVRSFITQIGVLVFTVFMMQVAMMVMNQAGGELPKDS